MRVRELGGPDYTTMSARIAAEGSVAPGIFYFFNVLYDYVKAVMVTVILVVPKNYLA